MREASKDKKKINWGVYAYGVAFLFLEVIAFLTFSLGNSIIADVIMGGVIVILLIIVSFRKIHFDSFYSFAFLLFPLVLFGIISAISIFAKNEMSMTMNVCLPIALTAFALIGYLISFNKYLKLSTLFTVIFSTLAILTLINFIATLIQFGPLHVITCKNWFIYYAGEKSSVAVSEMAYSLMGFKLREVTLQYAALYPTLLLCSAIGLFFISPKKNTKLFVLYCLFTLLAIIGLVFLAGKMVIISSLLVLIMLTLVVLTSKKIISLKAIKWVIGIGVALFTVLFILIFINGQWQWSFTSGFRNAISNNSFTDKIFNSYLGDYSSATHNIFSNDSLNNGHMFGHAFGDPREYPNYFVLSDFTNSWFFDLFVVGGLFGFVLFILFFILGMKGLFNFAKNSNETTSNKAFLIGFILVYFTYTFVASSGSPYIFFSDHLPMYYTGPFFVVIVLLCYAYCYKNVFININKNNENKEEIADENA